jgi:hypothetical protein
MKGDAMQVTGPHLSDEELLLAAEGELPGRGHLAACAACRARREKLEWALAEFAAAQREAPLPPGAGSRALLKAQLAHRAAGVRPQLGYRAMASAAAVLVTVAMLLWRAPGETEPVPKASLTPGATRQISAAQVCEAEPGDHAPVVTAVQRQVFEEYGMPRAEAARYEVDYLITPALGGSDDIRNLWPQPYAGSAWNAYVKDALEDRLRQMVCMGEVDLGTAQHDIAVNWIAAYKKYFHTDRPMAGHRRSRME